MRALTKTSFAGALAGLLMSSAAHAAGGIAVPMDEVRMLDFPQPVATVYVGNPTIADVNMIDAKRAFILGKNFGTTNVLALDEKGNQVFSKTITVSGRTGGMVTLQRGTAQTTYACVSSKCSPAPIPGDDNQPYSTITGQIDKREALAKQAIANSDNP
jgi:hypothetical protein